MTAENAIQLMALLLIKHFVCDFLFQTGRIARTKHKALQMESYFHTGMHALFAVIVLGMLGYHSFWYLGILSGGIHYGIDYTKGHVNDHLFPDPANMFNRNHFWWILGADQLCHSFTYLLMTWFIAKLS